MEDYGYVRGRIYTPTCCENVAALWTGGITQEEVDAMSLIEVVVTNSQVDSLAFKINWGAFCTGKTPLIQQPA